jgi:hypothetical protein
MPGLQWSLGGMFFFCLLENKKCYRSGVDEVTRDGNTPR